MEVGYDRMSIDEVAVRAGVHKTTVYRRWATKPELVSEAVRLQTEENVPIPDTGTVLGDLQALAAEVVANIGSDGGSRRSRSIVAAAATSDDLTTTLYAFWAQRLAASMTVVERAVERGELPQDSDANLIIETLVGPIWLRLLLTGETIDDDLAQRLAAFVAAGATHCRTETGPSS